MHYDSENSDSDTFEYEMYHLEYYDYKDEVFDGPPLIKKKHRIIAAVVQNQVEILRELLDSPKWYNLTDKWGYSLLQIAILRDNKEVFDYMLSMDVFPLDWRTKDGQTALLLALDGFVNNDIFMNGHFAYELIKKGASFDVICYDNTTPLHAAIERSYCKVIKLLIEKGVDVNVPDAIGYMPLQLVLGLDKSEDVIEIVMALLLAGAETTFDIFVHSIDCQSPFEVQQNLFLYTVDQYSDIEIRLEELLRLTEINKYFFLGIINSKIKVDIEENQYNYYCFCMLCSMDEELLRIVIEKYGSKIREIFSNTLNPSCCFKYGFRGVFSLENLNILLESNLREFVLSFISKLNTSFLFEYLKHDFSENMITELYCYLLSYGLTITESDVNLVYDKFHYCLLFKYFQYMDVKTNEILFYKNVVPSLLYNVTMDVDYFLKNTRKFASGNIAVMLGYFADSRIRELYHEGFNSDTILHNKPNLPEIPLLQELARNSFRRFFVDKFHIKTCKQFAFLLDCLPLSFVHKKIIMYETTLY